jgi:hypothetical protein
MRKRIWLLGLLLSATVCAATPQEALQSYSTQAKQENPAFKEFSARAGETFYHGKHKPGGKEMSCATCHTDNPKNTGKHETTGKEIQPLAPAANPERFTDPPKSKSGSSAIARYHCDVSARRDCNDRAHRRGRRVVLSGKVYRDQGPALYPLRGQGLAG